MNTKQIISSLVLIQIFLLVGSFGISSYYENEHSIFERSIIALTETKQQSDNLIHETEKYLAGVPYSHPENIIQFIESSLETIKNGGMIDGKTRLFPLPEEFHTLHGIAGEKFEIYVIHLNEHISCR